MSDKRFVFIRIVSLLLLITLFVNIPAFGATSAATGGKTYYVSPTGNDRGTGSSNSPWKTLQYAANKVAAGDTVIVKPGKYKGFVLGWDSEQNGTKERPITFKAEKGAEITSRNDKTPDGINLEGASYIIIEGFTINKMPRAGIRSVTNNHVVIRNNKADSNQNWGIFTGFSDNLVIEGNETTRSVKEHGIYVSNSCVNPVVRNNKSWGNKGCGIHFNGDLSMGEPGVITGAVIEGNIIYDNGKGGGSGINCDGVQSSIIRNNLLYNNHASGISLYQIDAAEGSKNNQIINNTIIQASDGRWALNIQGGSTGNQVFNNILLNLHSYRGSINIARDSLKGFASDYNIVMSRFSTDDGDNVIALAQWRKTTKLDLNSKTADLNKLFVKPSTNDYRLCSGSPAIDSGYAKKASSTDITGAVRPQGKLVDIGAYEYVN